MTGIPEVRDLRILVVVASDPVAHERAHDRKAGVLDARLHRVRDVPDVVAGVRLGDARVTRLLADVEQPPGLGRDLTDCEGVGAVRDKPVESDADVDRDEVAFLDAVVARDPVDDHRVRRDACGGREPTVALRRRDAAVVTDELLGDAVELARRDPRLNLLPDQRDRLGDELAGARHPFNLRCRLPDDHRVTATWSSARWISAKTSFCVRLPWIGTSLFRAR